MWSIAAVWLACSPAVVPATSTSTPVCAWSDPSLIKTEQTAARQLWTSNVNMKLGAVLPSRAYSGVWLRDSFWTLVALANPHVSEVALNRFARYQLRNGQVPTQFQKYWETLSPCGCLNAQS
jgi:hypothetical protein